jgi:hypothetical protein
MNTTTDFPAALTRDRRKARKLRQQERDGGQKKSAYEPTGPRRKFKTGQIPHRTEG